jgi:hypothetical protein
MDYLCLSLLGRPGESAPAFQSRLYAFWTHVLRNRPALYERVYSEAVEFEEDAGRVVRRYMVEPDAVDALLPELAAQDIGFADVDRDDVYSKAEASTNEWFQIE